MAASYDYILFLTFLGILLPSLCYTFWDEFYVTNPNILSPRVDLPLDHLDLKLQGWKQEDLECQGSKGYQGYRWVDGELNSAIALLFDERGFIAGIQPRIFAEEAENIGIPSSSQMPPFMKDRKRPLYHISIYFVEPSTICTTGRTAHEFEQQGTGTSLYIQSGLNVMNIPIKEQQIRRNQPLMVEGECCITIGRHYWYKLLEDMSCDSLFPVVPVYNGGDLNGFGIFFPGFLKNGIYTHTTGTSMNKYMKNVPRCFNSTSTVSMYYVFFTGNRWLNFC